MPKATQVRDLDKPKPRTHRFTKEIVSEGQYKTFDKASGKYTLKKITKEDLEKTVNTFQAMKKRGLKVPAPWKHDFAITAFTKIEEGDGGILEDSTKNAGFWDGLKVTQNEDGKAVLVGEIEVPGDPNDPSTPAGKVGTSVQDTSIYMRRDFELTDGSGEKLDNALMHIALVTHPIEPGQKNFEKIPDVRDNYIAMSQMVGAGDVGELGRLLAEVVSVYIPASTTLDTIVENLTIALEQLKMVSKTDPSDSQGPLGNKFEMEPLIMSKLSPAAEAILKAQVENPETGKPFTEAELATAFGSPKAQEPDPKQTQAELVMSAMQSTMQDERRRGYRSRINTLVETRRVNQEYADKELYPLADNYNLEVTSEGRIRTPEIESIVMALEAAPIPAKAPEADLSAMDATFYSEGTDVDEATASKIAEAMLRDELSIEV